VQVRIQKEWPIKVWNESNIPTGLAYRFIPVLFETEYIDGKIFFVQNKIQLSIQVNNAFRPGICQARLQAVGLVYLSLCVWLQ